MKTVQEYYDELQADPKFDVITEMIANPDGTTSERVKSEEERLAFLWELAEHRVARDERQADEDLHRETRVTVRKGLPILKTNLTTLRGTGTVSAAEQRRMLGDVTKASIETIEALISLRLLEEENTDAPPAA